MLAGHPGLGQSGHYVGGGHPPGGVEFGFYMFMLALAPVWRTRWGWGMLPLMLAVSFTWKAAALIGNPAPPALFLERTITGSAGRIRHGHGRRTGP